MLEGGAAPRLVSAFPVSANDACVVSACARCTSVTGHSLSTSGPVDRQHGVVSPGYLSPFGGTSAAKPVSLDIWCASSVGLRRINCHPSGCTMEVIMWR